MHFKILCKKVNSQKLEVTGKDQKNQKGYFADVLLKKSANDPGIRSPKQKKVLQGENVIIYNQFEKIPLSTTHSLSL